MTPSGLTPSVPEAIEKILRDRILSGGLKPDEPLREVALAEEFNVSRHTVREALLLLDRVGLVQKRSHRGSRVTVPDRDHLREVMALRQVAESGAVRRITRDNPALDDLKSLADGMEKSAAEEDWARYGELDRTFHTTLVATAGSARLTQLFARTIGELQLHFNERDQARGPGPHDHVVEHGHIVAYLKRGQVGDALSLLDRHLSDAERWLLES